jgi:hypothetical protein
MPFAMTMPEGVIAYTAGAAIEVDGTTVAPLTEYGSAVVAAGVPVILAAENGTYAIGVGGEAVEAEGENVLGGVLKSQSVSGANIYRLNGGVFEKRAASSGSIAANTAYYTADSESGTIALQKGAETSIGAIAADGEVKFYDLKGNRVENPTRGIYVTSEGVKVLVY